jgi:hypothetical protein
MTVQGIIELVQRRTLEPRGTEFRYQQEQGQEALFEGFIGC